MFQYYSELANNLKNDLLEPAKKFLEEQNAIGKKIYGDIKKVDKDYKEALSNLEKSRNKFYQSAKSAEIATVDCELSKVTYVAPQQKEKFLLKSTTMLKEAKDAEKIYLNSLKYTNNVRMIYIETSLSIMQSFQMLEEDFINYIQNLMRKFCIYSAANHTNNTFDIEKLHTKIEKINQNADIMNFIESNKTNLITPPKIEYLPYSIELRNTPIEQHHYPPEIVFNVIVTLQETFEKIENYVK